LNIGNVPFGPRLRVGVGDKRGMASCSCVILNEARELKHLCRSGEILRYAPLRPERITRIRRQVLDKNADKQRGL
jgi:hypothetical protein